METVYKTCTECLISHGWSQEKAEARRTFSDSEETCLQCAFGPQGVIDEIEQGEFCRTCNAIIEAPWKCEGCVLGFGVKFEGGR